MIRAMVYDADVCLDPLLDVYVSLSVQIGAWNPGTFDTIITALRRSEPSSRKQSLLLIHS